MFFVGSQDEDGHKGRTLQWTHFLLSLLANGYKLLEKREIHNIFFAIPSFALFACGKKNRRHSGMSNNLIKTSFFFAIPCLHYLCTQRQKPQTEVVNESRYPKGY